MAYLLLPDHLVLIMNPEEAKILFVEDDPRIEFMMKRRLSQMGYNNVRTTSNGPEALKQIKKDIPHLLITDQMMSPMTGLQLIEQIRSYPNNALIKIIMCSTDIDDLKQKALSAGADVFLDKPYDSITLKNAVAHALNDLPSLLWAEPA
jgi:CheY-like chemotaxis protein